MTHHGCAKTEVTADIRKNLRKISPRCIGLVSLASKLSYLSADVGASLLYLIHAGEVTHEAHQGYRYVVEWEQELRRRAEHSKARKVAGR